MDGLRAVAVLAVVLFHGRLGLPGGYIGVDVFFVISGYLITSLIISDLQAGRFTIVGFWERRARRIMPALFVLVVATLVAGWFLLLPSHYAALGRSAAWQSIFAANIHFWRATAEGYFASAADEMPLLHTWSLAVEEQFYMVVPVSLAVLFRFPRLRNRWLILSLFCAGFFLSLAASQYGVRHHRSATFYFLPTRAWELLLGSILAVLPENTAIAHHLLREFVAYVGLLGIVVPCLFYTGNTTFPGLAALAPCLGTALIIWCNGAAQSGGAPTTLGRFLANRFVVFVGLISYSLYLWHWPILALTRYYLGGGPFLLGYRLTMLALAVVLATLSWRFIELPFRRKTVCASRQKIFGFALTALGVCLVLGLAIQGLHGLPQRLPKSMRDAISEEYNDDLLFAKDMTPEDLQTGKLQPLGNPEPNQPITLLVWGDSHAMAALPAFDALLRMRGLSGRAATHAGTAPVINTFIGNQWGLGKDAPRFGRNVISYVQQKRIPHVVLVSVWNYELDSRLGPTNSLETALLATVQELVATGTQVWIMLGVPWQPRNVSTLLRRHRGELTELNQPCFCAKPDSASGVPGRNPAFLEQLIRAGARIIDPRPAFLDPSRKQYQIVRDGIVLYRDNQHLTKQGAELVLIPVLKESFLPYLASPPAVH